jgi:hypothetical protein
MHHTTFLHHTLHHMAHTWSYTIDPIELVVEELTEPAPAEESANTELIKGKLRCIPPIFLDFFKISILHYNCLCIKFIGIVLAP